MVANVFKTTGNYRQLYRVARVLRVVTKLSSQFRTAMLSCNSITAEFVHGRMASFNTTKWHATPCFYSHVAWVFTSAWELCTIFQQYIQVVITALTFTRNLYGQTAFGAPHVDLVCARTKRQSRLVRVPFNV
jgi:hypothetical protein